MSNARCSASGVIVGCCAVGSASYTSWTPPCRSNPQLGIALDEHHQRGGDQPQHEEQHAQGATALGHAPQDSDGAEYFPGKDPRTAESCWGMSFLRAAVVPMLCAAALLGPQSASATVESPAAAQPPRAGMPRSRPCSPPACPRSGSSARGGSPRRSGCRSRWTGSIVRRWPCADRRTTPRTWSRRRSRGCWPVRAGCHRDDELPYLLTALRNTYLTELRTRGRRPHTVELPAEASETLRSPRAEPEAAFEQRELLATIAALPPDFRDALSPSTWSASPTARRAGCSASPRRPSRPASIAPASVSRIPGGTLGTSPGA